MVYREKFYGITALRPQDTFFISLSQGSGRNNSYQIPLQTWESVGMKFYCGFHGKEWARQVSRFRIG